MIKAMEFHQVHKIDTNEYLNQLNQVTNWTQGSTLYGKEWRQPTTSYEWANSFSQIANS